MEENENQNKLRPVNDSNSTPLLPIENLIHVIRGQQVMIDSDLARLYGVETKRLKEQVKRNINRFPTDFMFELTKNETLSLRSQIATSNKDGVRGDGTGICQICFIPMRNASQISGSNSIHTSTGNTFYGDGQNTNAETARQRKIAALRTRISELRSKLDDAKYEERIMRLRGTDITSRTVFTSHASLIYRYERDLINLQHELSQLEQMGY